MLFVLLALAVTVHSSTQTYPRFEFRGNVLTNNSYVLRGAVNSPTAIGEGVNNSLHCVTEYRTVAAVDQVWGTGMIQEEWKSQSKQMETVIAMSQEGMEWCISVSEEEDNQECGDVTYLTTVDAHRVSISTWAQEQMVGTHMYDLYSQTNMCSYNII